MINRSESHRRELGYTQGALPGVIPLPTDTRLLPPEDSERRELHNELHARPMARIRLPALVVHIAVLNEGITRQRELEHLRLLAGQGEIHLDQLASTFLHLALPGGTLRWERHTEFTSYTLVQSLPPAALENTTEPDLLTGLIVDPSWLHGIPGRTLTAIELVLLEGQVISTALPAQQVRQFFAEQAVLASLMGRATHSCAITDFRLRPNGFERILVVATPETSETRAGRITTRLLELETYRMLALRGLPVAKAVQGMLPQAERQLADITAAVEDANRSDQELLDDLEALAARIERAIAQHSYRFAASHAYHALVSARLTEMREGAIPGTQTIGEFLQRRFNPAMATVQAAADRLTALSQRIERTGALLRTRVDITLETQNQQLLAKLSRGQELQFQLQRTVEGLSVVAISYYAVSLMLHGARAARAAGLPIHPEITVGLLIPLVVWGVWRLTRRIHKRLKL
ncbi:DUF3422 family protein [uncultured Meiothermus sp.]|jgi:uncharacterized membrane-anchored protein|uniref:DUF3422 family protein n=1 Tax=uncultured Meiothermus sp. TaxID=157471 RepID=UPI00262B2852|nr:DUF3422 domain-containing protein [uncultured Meiothermus sp.]